MSKLETWFAAFLRELWWQGTMHTFALWEMVLVLALVGKRAPWWLAIPGFSLWLFLRSLATKNDSDG